MNSFDFEEKGTACALGSIGDDNYGSMFENLIRNEKIEPLLEKIENINTGVCLVFCNGKDRGHITDLGASTMISSDYINSVWSKFEDLKLIFTELFILKHQKEVVYKLAILGLDNDKIFGFNLPSSFFIKNYFSDIKDLIEYNDILFANTTEALCFYNIIKVIIALNLGKT